MSAPTGIKVVADFAIYLGSFSVVASPFLLYWSHTLTVSRAGTIAAILGILGGAACIVLGFGLRHLRNWARLGFIVLLGLSLTGEVVGVLRLGKLPTLSHTFDILWSTGIQVTVLWYLSTREIKEMFRAIGQKLDAARYLT
jgi:hypothetical protein